MSSHKRSKAISFLVPYLPGISPGQRFRFEQYLNILTNAGYRYKIYPFFKSNALQREKNSGLLTTILQGYFRRVIHMFQVIDSEFVFIFRECAPIGPPVFEWFVARILRKKIIYDFDDAIWLNDNQHESKIQKILRSRYKVGLICRLSYRISCGNEYLRNYALTFNKNAIRNPTTIDTVYLHNRERYAEVNNSDSIFIGWTGSHSTLKYLTELEDVLRQIQTNYPHVHLLVIADEQPSLSLPNLKFVRWSKEVEITSLLNCSIGIMPLPDDCWTQGKCGFKALQYMALEIPAVVSPVGVNSTIVEDGITGFLAATKEEWIRYLSMLIESADLRKKIGEAGRKKVDAHYSVTSNASNFLSLFE